jgi:hypothetical protein
VLLVQVDKMVVISHWAAVQAVVLETMETSQSQQLDLLQPQPTVVQSQSPAQRTRLTTSS